MNKQHIANNRQTRLKKTLIFLRAGIIVSALLGTALHFVEKNAVFMSQLLKAFTIQSNILAAVISFVFLLYTLFFPQKKLPEYMYVFKFMSVSAILLTYIVFAVLLTPILDISYLRSAKNILLHNITPILALSDFIVDQHIFKLENKKLKYMALILPFLYSVWFLTTYAVSGVLPVMYFFFDYKKFGWLTISKQGIGVLIWMLVLGLLILYKSRLILKIKKNSNKHLEKTVLSTWTVLILITVFVYGMSRVFR